MAKAKKKATKKRAKKKRAKPTEEKAQRRAWLRGIAEIGAEGALAMATNPKKRSPKIKLPSSRARGRAGQPPEGCIGPPDPLPLFSDADMIKVVRDAAGIPLDKAVAERLVYMLRRAHGIGLAEGAKKNPGGVMYPPQYMGGEFVDPMEQREGARRVREREEERRARDRADRERVEANKKTLRRAMRGT